MSKTKWTPGPWRAGHYLGGSGSVDRVAPNGDRICHVADCHSSRAAHDAPLIATAPDLYARVAAHAAQCGACGGTGTPNRMSAMDDSRAPDGSCSVCYEDRRVMAKARGEAP